MPELNIVPLSEVPQDHHTNGGHKWTEEEKELLRQWYGKVPTKQLAQQLGIQPKYVNFQARRLGLANQPAPAFRHKWTDAERELIRKWYGKVPMEKLAQHFGVSKKALSLVAMNLGLKQFRRAANHQFTETEDEVLRREYEQTHESRDRLALKLELSISQVQHRLAKLGLLKKTDRPNYRWTPAEAARLEKLVEQGRNVDQIAKLMNRSPNAIKIYAHRHRHLSFRADGSWYTKKDVCEILGVDHKWLQRRIDSGMLKASWHHGYEPQKNGQGAWHIDPAALRDYLRTYPQEVNGRNVDLVAIINLFAPLQESPYEHYSDEAILHYQALGWSNIKIGEHYGKRPQTVGARLKRIEKRREMEADLKSRPFFCPRGHEMTGANVGIDASRGSWYCRLCKVISVGQRRQKYQETHREELKAKGRLYYQNHKEQFHQYYEANKEKIALKSREYYQARKARNQQAQAEETLGSAAN